ncbi:MAG: hypothetical protein HYR91_10155 [Flavobacteriia bacterium]|nr:hypothetical protein [Flavobacteriia bacterium]
MNFNENKKSLSDELDQFMNILNELIPHYEKLIQKKELDSEEIKELGDVEYFLLEVNAKINEIKSKLDQHLFGHSLDLYYKYKEKAKEGDLYAIQKVNRMRDLFTNTLKGEALVNWN